MHPGHALGTSLYFEGNKTRTFEELATRAHNMELSIANKGTKYFLIFEVKKGKNESSDTRKITNSVINEAMVVHESPLKPFSKKKKQKLKENMMTKRSIVQLLKKGRKKFIHFLTLMLQTC